MGNVDYADNLAKEFGCKIGSHPSTYLGLSLGAAFRFVVIWDGRLTPHRNNLSSIPIYFMSLFGIPRVVRL